MGAFTSLSLRSLSHDVTLTTPYKNSAFEIRPFAFDFGILSYEAAVRPGTALIFAPGFFGVTRTFAPKERNSELMRRFASTCRLRRAAQNAAEHGAVGGTLIHANTRTLDAQKTWLVALTLRSFGYPRRVASG